MKLRHVFFAMLATGLFAACNNDDIVVDNPQNETEGEAFIGLKIALPSSTSPGTRDGQGTPNDDFADGDEIEWKVDKVKVLVFNGVASTSEVIFEYDAVPSWLPNTSTANITVSSKNLGVKEVESTGGLGVLVIANPDNVTLPTDKIDYESIAKALQTDNSTKFKEKGFVMTNSPIVAGDAVQYLAPCTAYLTELDASKNPAQIFLERILAKVEVESGFGSWTYTVPEGKPNTVGDAVTFTKWGLDITNTQAYLVRQINSGWIGYECGNEGTATGLTGDLGHNRFIGKKTDPQRIYWAEDTDYTTKGKYSTLSEDKMLILGDKNIDYCLENTFDVANQLQDRTTRIVMKAAYKFADEDAVGEFYRSSKKTIYSSAAKLLDEMSLYLGVPLTEDEKTKGTYVKVTGFTLEKTGETVKVIDAAITSIKYGKYIGDQLVADSEVTLPLEGETDEIKAQNSIFTSLTNTIGTLDTYTNGECYYIARIKHFGETLTPWKATDPTYGDDPLASKNYLGRYGVVRNNWYVLKINAADKGPGEPTIPEPKSTPDDEVNYYIDVQMHILSWAKRYQDVEW